MGIVAVANVAGIMRAIFCMSPFAFFSAASLFRFSEQVELVSKMLCRLANKWEATLALWSVFSFEFYAEMKKGQPESYDTSRWHSENFETSLWSILETDFFIGINRYEYDKGWKVWCKPKYCQQLHHYWQSHSNIAGAVWSLW